MDNQFKCPKCSRFIEPNFLFCPYCGEPVSGLSEEIKARQEAVAQLKLLSYLIDKVQDPTTLRLLEKLVEKYEASLK